MSASMGDNVHLRNTVTCRHVQQQPALQCTLSAVDANTESAHSTHWVVPKLVFSITAEDVAVHAAVSLKHNKQAYVDATWISL